MDVLSSQANIAGYKAVMMAAAEYQRFFPMLMTAAGTVKAARVVILGVGVAGLQAIATAKRLGAVIEASDVRPSVKEQVESLGGKFIDVPYETDEEREAAVGVGGYAKPMPPSWLERQKAEVAKRVAQADVVITTALIPGRPAPVLVTEDMVKAMKPGSVIVDLAAPQGGNCPLTEPGKTVVKHGVTLIGQTNVPALVAADASALYARNLLDFLKLIITKEGTLNVDLEDDIVAACLMTQGGEVKRNDLQAAFAQCWQPDGCFAGACRNRQGGQGQHRTAGRKLESAGVQRWARHGGRQWHGWRAADRNPIVCLHLGRPRHGHSLRELVKGRRDPRQLVQYLHEQPERPCPESDEEPQCARMHPGVNSFESRAVSQACHARGAKRHGKPRPGRAACPAGHRCDGRQLRRYQHARQSACGAQLSRLARRRNFNLSCTLETRPACVGAPTGGSCQGQRLLHERQHDPPSPGLRLPALLHQLLNRRSWKQCHPPSST
jgi:hypothetical protein